MADPGPQEAEVEAHVEVRPMATGPAQPPRHCHRHHHPVRPRPAATPPLYPGLPPPSAPLPPLRPERPRTPSRPPPPLIGEYEALGELHTARARVDAGTERRRAGGSEVGARRGSW